MQGEKRSMHTTIMACSNAHGQEFQQIPLHTITLASSTITHGHHGMHAQMGGLIWVSHKSILPYGWHCNAHVAS